MPDVNLNPYLSFPGTTREAMSFYQSVLGGDLNVLTYADGGIPHEPTQAERVMHAQLEAPPGLVLMAADSPTDAEHQPGGSISVSLSGVDATALTGYWEAFSSTGSVLLPLDQAPWGDSFGMCTDRFGITWMFNIAAATT